MRPEIEGGLAMTKRVMVARRNPGKSKKSHGDSVDISHKHSNRKRDGLGTARYVMETAALCPCTIAKFITTARDSNLAPLPREFDSLIEIRKFGILSSGAPAPEGYQIAECILALADKVSASQDPGRCFLTFSERPRLQSPGRQSFRRVEARPPQ